MNNVREWLTSADRVLVSHFYVPPELQDLAWDTGGIVGDSLEMARFAADHPGNTVVVAGVRFMGETVKILAPHKRVIMLSMEASCSLADGCKPADLDEFITQNPGRTVVVYANTSVEVKAIADWVVTSSTAVRVVKHLVEKGESILWAPDKHLGEFVKKVTGADMAIFSSSCIVHEEFVASALVDLRKQYPDALVLAHPESPMEVLENSHVVGSTSLIVRTIVETDHPQYIIATDAGVVHHVNRLKPGKTILVAPTATNGTECNRCGRCPYMAMNTLEALERCISNSSNDIVITDELREKAIYSVQRTLELIS